MTSIDTQDNPVVAKVGTRVADATIIDSNKTGSDTTFYQIENLENGDIINVKSSETIPTSQSHAKVISVTTARLKIILKGRTKFRVRVKQGGPWSAWESFTTRDKRYQTPDSITQLTDDSTNTATVKDNRTIKVTNNAKASVRFTSRGATVRNTDTVYADTISSVNTNRGATVKNDGTIVNTARGATINNS